MHFRRPIKKIRTQCYGGITAGYHSPWEDVWITLFVGKRKKETFGPCICSFRNLDHDIDIEQSLLEKHQDWDTQQFYDYQIMRNRLKTERFVADRFVGDGKEHDRLPNIYTADEYITMSVAEDAMLWWLKECKLISDGVEPRFKWNKPSFYVISC